MAFKLFNLKVDLKKKKKKNLQAIGIKMKSESKFFKKIKNCLFYKNAHKHSRLTKQRKNIFHFSVSLTH